MGAGQCTIYLFQCVSILSTSMVIVMFVNMKQYSSTRDGWLCEHSCPGLCGQKRHPSLFHAKFLARVAPMLFHTKPKFADILLDSFKRNDVVSLGGQHKHSWIVLQGKLFQTKNTPECIVTWCLVSRPLEPVQHQISPDYVIRMLFSNTSKLSRHRCLHVWTGSWEVTVL